MNVTYFGYNGFILKSGSTVLAVDPGTSLYVPRLGSIIPKYLWPAVTHVLVTHGDPDHFWHADRVARISGAPVICGNELVETRDGQRFLAHPRKRALTYRFPLPELHPMALGESLAVGDLGFESHSARHGDLRISLFFGLKKEVVTKKPGDMFAAGATSFLVDIKGFRVAILGDTVFLDDWEKWEPNLLLIPIGGRTAGNTMDEDEALRAVERIGPRAVIPCHYDCGMFFKRKANPADTDRFKKEVESMGAVCRVLAPGEMTSFPVPAGTTPPGIRR